MGKSRVIVVSDIVDDDILHDVMGAVITGSYVLINNSKMDIPDSLRPAVKRHFVDLELTKSISKYVNKGTSLLYYCVGSDPDTIINNIKSVSKCDEYDFYIVSNNHTRSQQATLINYRDIIRNW